MEINKLKELLGDHINHPNCKQEVPINLLVSLIKQLEQYKQSNEDLKICLMTTVEWFQSHYPNIKVSSEILDMNREILLNAN